MSYLFDDRNTSYGCFMLGMYSTLHPLYNHTTRSLILREFTVLISMKEIREFVSNSSSDISYNAIIELYEILRLEIDRLYRLKIHSLKSTIKNPYTKKTYKILSLNVIACHYIDANRAFKLNVQMPLRIVMTTLSMPIYALIHMSTLGIFILLAPFLISEMRDPCSNIDNEERWAKDILKLRELDQDNILQNLNNRLIDLSTRFENVHDFGLRLTQNTMKKSSISNKFVRIWGLDFWDIVDLESSNSGELNSIFNDPNKGQTMFMLYDILCKLYT